MKIQEQIIFPNFVYSLDIVMDNRALAEVLLHEEKNIPGRLHSNSGGWQNDIMHLEDFEFRKLFDKGKTVCQEIFNTWKLNKSVVLKNAWANINRKHNFNYPHFHPKSIFSAIYYVSTPSGCGNVVIKRSDIQEHYIDESDSEYTSKTISIVPHAGLLLLFPSYLNHYVEGNSSDEARISIAMNFGGIG
jgi:uncharacterized protein (TIGR02466 family)